MTKAIASILRTAWNIFAVHPHIGAQEQLVALHQLDCCAIEKSHAITTPPFECVKALILFCVAYLLIHDQRVFSA